MFDSSPEFFLGLGSSLIRDDYLSVEEREKPLGGGVTGLNGEMSVKQNVSNNNDELLSGFHLSCCFSRPLFPSFSPSSRPSLFISSCPVLLSSPAGQISVILTSPVRRSWDTLRQCWERISVEFNLEQCFTPRRRNSFSSINESNISPSLDATGVRFDTVFCPSVTFH